MGSWCLKKERWPRHGGSLVEQVWGSSAIWQWPCALPMLRVRWQGRNGPVVLQRQRDVPLQLCPIIRDSGSLCLGEPLQGKAPCRELGANPGQRCAFPGPFG